MKKVKIVKIAAAVLMAVGGCFALFGSEAWAVDAVTCNVVKKSAAQCAYDNYSKFSGVAECSSGSSLDTTAIDKCSTVLKKSKFVTSDGSAGVSDSVIDNYYSEVAKGLIGCKGLAGQSGDTIRNCINSNASGTIVTPSTPKQNKTGDDDDPNGGGGTDDDDDDGSGSSPDVPTAADLPNKAETSILPGNWKIWDIIRFVVNIMTGAVVVAGTVGIVFCGYMWMTARDNEAQVTKAKTRMLEVVIGLVAWVLFGVLIQFIMPNTKSVYENGVVVKSSIIEEKK